MENEKTYTRDDVDKAVNAAANLLNDLGDYAVGERDTDLINIVVNAALVLLDKPDASLDDVLHEGWDNSDRDEPDGAKYVRSWWSSWS